MRVLTFSKTTGPKPTKTLLVEASTLAKPDTDDHMVVAMALRPNGVTQAEVITLLGHPHRNKLKKLLQDNKVKQYVLPEGGRSTRIKLVKR
jgi:hypothetical protein